MVIKSFYDVGTYFIIDDFLPPDRVEIMLQEIKKLQPRLSKGKVIMDGRRVNNELKNNRTVSLASDNPIAENLLETFWCPDLKNILKKTGNRFFNNMFYPQNEKVQLSVYGDGDYYGQHMDGQSVTINLFLHRRPKQFQGGELVLRDQKKERVIHFNNNRLIVFDGMILHEVLQVQSQSKKYMDSRFTVQYWANRQ